MIRGQRGRAGSEQLPVLWTWLLEHYVPVAYIVADLDELETSAPNDSVGAPGGRVPDMCARLGDRRAA